MCGMMIIRLCQELTRFSLFLSLIQYTCTFIHSSWASRILLKFVFVLEVYAGTAGIPFLSFCLSNSLFSS